MKKGHIGQLVLAFFTIISLPAFLAYQRHPAADPNDGITDVRINDAFWSPRFDEWRTKTVTDVFNKFEGAYNPKGSPSLENDFEKMGTTRNAFQNLISLPQANVELEHTTDRPGTMDWCTKQSAVQPIFWQGIRTPHLKKGLMATLIK